MKRRIFYSIFIIACFSAFCTALLISLILYNQNLEQVKNSLAVETQMIADVYQQSGSDYLVILNDLPQRVTLVGQDGQVLWDNQANPTHMANHNDRQEILTARENGFGESVRYSSTLLNKTIYYAIALDDGSVIRVSTTFHSGLRLLLHIIPYLLVIYLLITLLAALIAKRQTLKILRTINDLDLDQPLAADSYPELAPMLSRLHKQKQQINQQIADLSQQKEEFMALSTNMREGLILLNQKAEIVSINESAMHICQTTLHESKGQSIYRFCRDLAMQKTIESLLNNQEIETIYPLRGKTYQILATPICNDRRQCIGGLLLFIDISEKMANEQMRREFSANVSHELKTPLTIISGYAEIMANGLAKVEDHQQFATKIYNEAHRLLQLIEDIIQLSSLDEAGENQDMPKEPIDIVAIAKEESARLQPLAAEKEILIQENFADSPIYIYGNRQILQEMFYNLIENAIKYNHIHGHVRIGIVAHPDEILFSVADDGIGIAPEEQERVFERFYRVDKSRSVQYGGTGLGLSIVKHGAVYHQAKVMLHSQLQQGTVVTIAFPPLQPSC